MDREKVRIIAGFAVIGLLVLAVPALRLTGGSDRDGAPPAPFTPMPLNDVGQFRGVWLQVHNNDPGCPFEQYIREIASTGANTVCLQVSGEQPDASSNIIYTDARRTPSDARLVGMFKLADELKMRVVFMPIVLLSDPAGNEWRGTINPDDWSRWWASYNDFVRHYAALCQENGVDMFIVGSELISTERQESRWRSLISRIRRRNVEIVDSLFRRRLQQPGDESDRRPLADRFDIDDIDALAGSRVDPAEKPELAAFYRRFADEHRMLLSYSSNWDHYTVPKFWDDLDAVGMTTYHNINTLRTADPSIESLMEAWRPIRNEIVQWQRTVRKPIFFTEVGWPSLDGCSSEPWNYIPNGRSIDLAEQQRCMDSFLRTFGHENWVGGILIWKWRDHPGMTGALDDRDASRLNYPPCGKPVMKTLQTYFASPNPTAATRPALAEK